MGFPAWVGDHRGDGLLGRRGARRLERVLIRPFDPHNHLAITIVTLGLYLVLNSLAGVIWAFDPRGFPTPFPNNVDDYVSIVGARIYYAHIGTAVMVFFAVLLITLLLADQDRARVPVGRRNLESGRLLGIHIGRTIQVELGAGRGDAGRSPAA